MKRNILKLFLTNLNWNLSSNSLKNLKKYGYSIIDDVMHQETAELLYFELLTSVMEKSNLLSQNSTILIDKGIKSFLPKHGIGEFDFTNQKVIDSLPNLNKFCQNSNLIECLQPLLYPNNERKLIGQTVKAQINFGNLACFPMHYDTDYQLDSRTITAIFYLNKDYTSQNGGQLRIYPTPFHPIDIEPIFNRLVLFSSPFSLHRVLPSNSHRFCFTIWISSDKKFEIKKDKSFWNELMNPKARNLLSKYIYSNEWAISIEESHLDNPLKGVALKKHFSDVEILKKYFQPKLDNLKCKIPINENDLPIDYEKNIIWF